MGYRTGVGKVPHQMAVWKILCLHDVFGGMLNVNQSSLRRATNWLKDLVTVPLSMLIIIVAF